MCIKNEFEIDSESWPSAGLQVVVVLAQGLVHGGVQVGLVLASHILVDLHKQEKERKEKKDGLDNESD